MRESLKLAESEIVAAVETQYGISAAALFFLPLGNDSATSVYRLDSMDGASYLVKLRTRAGFSIPSLAIPKFLRAQGVPHILVPIPTLGGTLWVKVGEFALTLYPFIENGRTAAAAGLTDAQCREFGSVVHQFHTVPLPSDLLSSLPREQFVPKDRELIPALQAAIAQGNFANDAERALSEFWRLNASLIQQLVSQADTLGAQLRHASSGFVLCHADMHTYNLLLNPANEFWLVDWDEVILSLPERDLMFVVGGIHSTLVTPLQTALFLQGYGGTLPDAAALRYYRFAWAIQDIAAYGASVFLLPHLSAESRNEAVEGLKGLFEPGAIIELAQSSKI